MRGAIFGVVAVAAAVAGCGPPDVAEYAAELELAYCTWQTECHNFAEVDDCVAARTIDQNPDFVYLVRAVAAGTAEYDGEAALTCLAAIRGQDCSEQAPDTPEACDAVFLGRIGRNGPCMSSLECVGDAVCGFDPRCTDECCPGACRVFAEPLAEGEACGGSVACEEGLFCAFDPDTSTATVCTKHVKAGGACGNGEQCIEAAYCDGTKCQKYVDRAAGESCGDPADRCAAPAECHYVQVDSETGESRPVCVAPGGLGAKCDPLDEGSCARFDTVCDAETKVCRLLPVPGAACVDGGCIGYARCEGVQYGEFAEPASPGTCVARAGAGEPCGEIEGSYVDCLGDLWCDERSVCAQQVAPEASECPVPGDG